MIVLWFFSFFLAVLPLWCFFEQKGTSRYLRLFSFSPLLFLELGFFFLILSFFHQLTGINLLCIQIVFLLVLQLFGLIDLKKTIKRPTFLFRLPHLNLLEILLFVFITAILATSFIQRSVQTLTQVDDKGYRASAPLHWRQNKSILPFETHNERKRVFVLGSGEVFLWPLLFTESITPGLQFYWLSFPLSGLLIYAFALKQSRNRAIALFLTLLFVATIEMNWYFTESLVQESWLTVALLSYLGLVFNKIEEKNQKTNLTIISIAFSSLLWIKPTAFIYLPSLLIFIPLIGWKKLFQYILPLILISLSLNGYIFVFIQNWLDLGTPFGTRWFVDQHKAFFSLYQLYVHCIRLIAILLQPPFFFDSFDHWWNTNVLKVIFLLGAHMPLDGESEGTWVGTFENRNNAFQFTGLLLLFCISCQSWLILRLKKFTQTKRIKILSMVIFSVTGIAQVFIIRWAEGSDIPYHHLISSFAFIIAFCSFFLPTIRNKSPMIFCLIIFCLIIQSEQILLSHFYRIHALTTPALENEEARLYGKITPRSKILVLENNYNTVDYSLFMNENTISNTVFSIPSQRHTHDILTETNTIVFVAEEKDVDYIVSDVPDEPLVESLITRLDGQWNRVETSDEGQGWTLKKSQ